MLQIVCPLYLHYSLPLGADELLLCGTACAGESEDEYDKELRSFKKDFKDVADKKECEGKCPEDDEDCIKVSCDRFFARECV